VSTSLRVAQSYITSIVTSCKPLCDEVHNICQQSKVVMDTKLESKASPGDRNEWQRQCQVAHVRALSAMTALRSSIVGISLPSLVVGAALLPSHIRLVHDISPKIIDLLSSLSHVVNTSPPPQLAGTSTLLDEEEFKEDRRDEPVATVLVEHHGPLVLLNNSLTVSFPCQ
jgi:hypothetical protein